MADAGRVIAGSARGVRLTAPGPGTRALTDRVKQTLFAILEPDLDGARVLDLFAGSGAGAIEALSRGARSAVLVERDGRAAAVIRENLARAGVADDARVVVSDAVTAVADAGLAADGPFGIVLVDPPYDREDLLTAALTRLGAAGAPLVADAIVVAKHFWRVALPPRIGLLASARERRFGETALTFYRRQPAGPEEAPDS